MDNIEPFKAFIKGLCGTAPPSIVADGRWHSFRGDGTRSKSSRPVRYMLHDDNHPIGMFWEWRGEKAYYWTPGGDSGTADKDELRRLAKTREEARRVDYAKAATSALEFFQKHCTPINGASHPYLDRKQIAPFGSRQGSGRPFGLGDVPCVIVPIRGPDKGALTVQAIRADGERRFWKGSTTEGGYCLIGSPKTPGAIVLCEGFATGCSIHAATGLLVIVCLSASNMIRVSRWAGHQYPGRQFVVAGDDDWHLPLKEKPEPNVGRESALLAARNLGGQAVFPDMCGIATEGGDDFNDMAVEVGLDDVRAVILGEPMQLAEREPDRVDDEYVPADLGPTSIDQDFGPQPETQLLTLLSPAQWAGQAVPVREWRLQNLIPNGQATLFTGAGAVGKSLATQQMTSCIAMGMPFLGVKTWPAPSLYITCEDDADELQRRQVAICHRLGIKLEQTAGKVFLLSLYGELHNALCTFDEKGEIVISERYKQIVATCLRYGIRHVTLDNTAHFFTGNEIIRSEVAAFVNLCNRLAREIGGTIVLVGHPNKAGDSYSGSTAWENQVRSRLFMETPVVDGIVSDPDLRVIRNEKANYAQKNNEIRFYWHQGAFALENQIEVNEREKMVESATVRRDNALFLRLLDQLTREKRHVSHSPSAGNFAPKVMVSMTEAKGTSKPRFHQAMERLLLSEQIATSQPLWLGKDRHPVVGLSRQEQPK